MRRKAAERLTNCTTERNVLSDVSDCDDSYEDHIKKIEGELRQLEQKCHPEYLRMKRKIDAWHAEELLRAEILNDHRLETIECEYKKDIEACDRDYEAEKRKIKDYLLSLCEELKKRLEQDKRNIELTPSGDILDFKPAVTRKLRRRAAGSGTAGGEISSSNGQNNLTYWNDLFCGSLWSLTPSPLPSATCKGLSGDVLLPSVGSVIKSPTLLESGTDSAEAFALDSVNDPEGRPVNPGSGDYGSDLPKPAKLPKINLFGSLGLNMFGGSLFSHLLTSFNATATSSTGCPGGIAPLSGSIAGGGAYLSGSGGASLLTAPSTSSAVAAGFMGSQTGGLVSSPMPLHPPQSTKKRRQQNAPPSAQLNLLLPEDDIKMDLTIIHSVYTGSDSTPSNLGGSGRKFAGSGASAAAILPTGYHHSYTTASSGGVNGQHRPDSPLTHLSGKLGDPDCSAGQGTGTAISCSARLAAGRDVTGSNGLAGSPPLSPTALSANSPFTSPAPTTPSGSAVTGPAVWIDDGRLYCGQKCFQTGASVILEGREGSNQRFPGTVVAVGAQDVAIRRSSDHGICRVTVQQLKQGRYALWLNAKPS